MNIKDLQLVFQKELNSLYEKEEVQNFFFMLLESFSNLSRLDLALDTNLSITKKEQDLFFSALHDLKHNKPIQYILGNTSFYDLEFKVDENVLIPRPETEELVSWILTKKTILNNKNINILDIGTGSGCIAVTLAKHIPNAQIHALDISKNALHIAKENATLNNVNVNFIEADVLNLPKLNNQFDVIVSNPPYVRVKEKQQMASNVLNYEPHLALFVADIDPLVFYRAICQLAKYSLKPNGLLYFEINEYLAEDTLNLMKEFGFQEPILKQDMFKKDRFVRTQK